LVFVDTNVLMYAVGREHPLRQPARRFFADAATNQRPLATSSEVLQELVHAYLPVDRARALAAALQIVERTRMEVWPLEREDVILGIEARGFLIGAPLAYKLGKPFVPVRKEGKLPYETKSVKYALEYGQNVVEVHTDAVSKGQRAVILNDLLATGGTMAAGAELVESMGGEVAGLAAVIELIDLDGRERLSGYGVYSLVQY